MKHKELLLKSQQFLSDNPSLNKKNYCWTVFPEGAQWMCDALNLIAPQKTRTLNINTNFFLYGLFKYSICSVAGLLSFFILLKVHYLLTPLSIIVFYFFETLGLFLFPLLIDEVKTPIISSSKMTLRMGFIKVIMTVIPIAVFMLWGLSQKEQRLRNWHVGCLAILFWYVEEIRNRC